MASIEAWKNVVLQVAAGMADEALQRRAWFGLGPEVSSPGEEINMLLGDAALRDFLGRPDNGLTAKQQSAGQELLDMVEQFCSETPELLVAADVIDNPKWQKIRAAAATFADSKIGQAPGTVF